MDISDLRNLFETHEICRVKVGGFDIDGILRGKYLSLDKFWSAQKTGFGFCEVIFGWDSCDVLYDNSKITGWHTGFPDLHARIDLDTFRLLPDEPHTASFLVDFFTPQGDPYPACPRALLKQVIAKADTMGFVPYFAAEFEFWVFQETPESLHQKGFRNLRTLSPGMCGYSWLREGQYAHLVHDILDTCQKLDIEIEGLHTETGPGVYEAALRYDTALRAADKAALFKTVLKLICARHGLSVTFMAKWNHDLPGSSGHLHQSLWSSDKHQNQFADKADPWGMSTTAKQYLAGQLALMPEFTAFYSPTINSYKRYVKGVWAPLNVSWGLDNRTCAVRAIGKGEATATRLEFRQTAADIQPHIAMACCLASGLHGIEQELIPPRPMSGDAAVGPGTPLPLTLTEAVAQLEVSQTASQLLGATFVEHYIRTRQWEIAQYNRAVTDWEIKRYFESV
ncbi:MAG: glutamine synthetase [Myxococcales bacterium]|nr:glutamine synthetase [Myxococcales bacterium]